MHNKIHEWVVVGIHLKIVVINFIFVNADEATIIDNTS
jgi:hypothetical protein